MKNPIDPLQETTPAGAKPKKLQRPEGGKMPASRQIYSVASWFSAAMMMARRRRWWWVEPEGGRWGSCRGGIGESWWCCSGRRRRREQRQWQGGRSCCCHLPCPAGNTPLRPPVEISWWWTLHGATEVHSACMLTDTVGSVQEQIEQFSNPNAFWWWKLVVPFLFCFVLY